MATPFQAAAAAAETAIDAVFAEAFSFAPMTVPPNGVATADTDREEVASLPALFDAGGLRVTPGAPGTVPVTTLAPQIVFAAAATGPVRTGDRMTRLATGQVYELRDPKPAGHGRIASALAEVRA